MVRFHSVLAGVRVPSQCLRNKTIRKSNREKITSQNGILDWDFSWSFGIVGIYFRFFLGGCFRDFPDLFDFFGDFLDFWDFRIFWMFGIIFGTFWIYGLFWISLLEIFRISIGFFGEIPKIPRILKQILKIPNNLNIGISGIIWIFLGFSGFSWDFYDFCDSCLGLMFSFL